MTRCCSIDGCDREYQSSGFCAYHLHLARRRGLLNTGKCLVPECTTNQYAKGRCYNHWFQHRKNGEQLYLSHKCLAEGCQKKIIIGEYCKPHQRRIDTGAPLDASHHDLISGVNNPRWNGGVSEYKNHYQMKLVRKKKVLETGGKCEVCGEKGLHLHHKDASKDNHDASNFTFLCQSCHISIHKALGTRYGRPLLRRQP